VNSPRPARLRVGVVGVGRVGAAVGVALARAEHEIVAASAVSDQSLRRAERMLPGVPIVAPDEVLAVSDFVLVAVPDDALRPLIAGLAATDSWREGQIAAHTSGAQGIGVLDPAAARGVLALALHPVMTFTGRPEDADRLDGQPAAHRHDEEADRPGEAPPDQGVQRAREEEGDHRRHDDVAAVQPVDEGERDVEPDGGDGQQHRDEAQQAALAPAPVGVLTRVHADAHPAPPGRPGT